MRIHTRVQILAVAAAMLLLLPGCENTSPKKRSRQRPPAPVAVAEVEYGEIDAYRTFSGSLEASASFVVSTKIAGRVEQVLVDIGDGVAREMIVAKIDDEEYRQALAQAKADLLVEKANLAEANGLLEIAGRTLERIRTLRERGVSSEAELDTVRTDFLTKGARVAVLEAQVARAKAALKKAKIQLNDATIQAKWHGDESERLVAERYVDDGAMVTANTQLLKIVDLSPLMAVFFVPEREYGSLKVGQTVLLQTDAFPGERHEGAIARIAPVFQNNSRQARVEVSIPNEDMRLKPGMFVKTQVKVQSVSGAAIVPADAIVNRDDVQGIFVVKKGTRIVLWREVTVGIRQGNRVEVQGDDLEGLVVTLGQQLIEDGSKVSWEVDTTAQGVPRNGQ